jgi:hypothetical protein
MFLGHSEYIHEQVYQYFSSILTMIKVRFPAFIHGDINVHILT